MGVVRLIGIEIEGFLLTSVHPTVGKAQPCLIKLRGNVRVHKSCAIGSVHVKAWSSSAFVPVQLVSIFHCTLAGAALP